MGRAQPCSQGGPGERILAAGADPSLVPEIPFLLLLADSWGQEFPKCLALSRLCSTPNKPPCVPGTWALLAALGIVVALFPCARSPAAMGLPVGARLG